MSNRPAEGIAWGLIFSIPLWLVIIYLCLLITGCETPKFDHVPWGSRPDTKPTPLPMQDAISNIRWHGANYQGAEIVAELPECTMSDDRIFYSKPCPSDWPSKTETAYNPDGSILKTVTIQGIACIFYGKDSVEGGKYEFMRPGQTMKMTDNIKNGYNGLRLPNEDEQVYTCLVSIDGSKRTNITRVQQ